MHTLSVQGANQHTRSSLGFNILSEDFMQTWGIKPANSRQQDAGSNSEPQLYTYIIRKTKTTFWCEVDLIKCIDLLKSYDKNLMGEL